MRIQTNIDGRERGMRAFTLIEVLLSIAILGGIITAVYASWTAVLRGSQAGLSAAADAQRERVTQDSIRTAFSSAVLFQQNLPYYAFFADTSDDKFAMVSLVAHLPETFPGGGIFEDQRVRRVTFKVETTNGHPVLVMRQLALLTPTNSGDEGFRVELANNIRRFAVDFWDTNQNDWVSDWPLTNQLPRMVKVTLDFGRVGPGHSSEPSDELVSVVSISGTTVTPDIQIGTGIPGVAPVKTVPKGPVLNTNNFPVTPPVSPPLANNPLNRTPANNFVPNIPKPSRTVPTAPIYNPNTGQFINPSTGLPVQPTYPYYGAGLRKRTNNTTTNIVSTNNITSTNTTNSATGKTP